jgi:hypothetical protein
MYKLVSQGVKNSSEELYRKFESARPFRHVAIDDFLDEAFARSLLDKLVQNIDFRALISEITGIPGLEFHPENVK